MEDQQIEREIRKIKCFLAANRIPVARIVPAISRQYLNTGNAGIQDFISNVIGKIKKVFAATPGRDNWDISGTKCWLFFRRILEANVGFSEAAANKKNRIERNVNPHLIELTHIEDTSAARINRKDPEFTFVFYDSAQQRVYIRYCENGLVQISVDNKPFEERYSRPVQLNAGFYPCDLKHDFNFYIEGQRNHFTAVMQLGSFPRGLEKIKGGIFASGSGHRLMLSEGKFNFDLPGMVETTSSPVKDIIVTVGGNGFLTFRGEILALLQSAGLSLFHINSLDRDVLINPTCTFILDFHKGSLAGILGVCGRDGKDLSDTEILTMAVRPDFQHRGIGKKMWSEMLAMLQKAGCEEFIILTPDNQPIAKWIKEMEGRGQIKRLLVSQSESNPWLWSYHACEVSFGANTATSSPVYRPEISCQDAERVMEQAAKEAIEIRAGQLKEVKREALRNNRPNIARDTDEEISRLPLTREQTCELACSLIPDKLSREFAIPSLLVSGWAYGNFHCILLFVNKDAVFVMDATIRQFTGKNNNYFGPLSEYIRRTGFKDLLVHKNELKEWSRGMAGVEKFEQFLSRSSSPAGKDIPVTFRSMPGRKFLCVDAACCFFRDEWIPEEIKKALRKKYGKDCSYTREHFAIGDLKPKQRCSIIGQSNLVAGFPCWALQIILDFSNSTGLTFVSSCKIYQDRDKPKICGKFPAIKKDLSPCWFELFKQRLWGLYYLVYRDLLEEKPVRTFKEAMGSGEGIFITKNGHSFLSREFEQNPGNVVVVLQPAVNRLVGVYRKEGIKLHLSSSPAHPVFLSPDGPLPQGPVIPPEIILQYRARGPGGISEEFLQFLWVLNTNLKIVLREVKGLYERKGRLLPPCYIYGGILARFISSEPWPITSETDLDVKIIDNDNYTIKDQQRGWFENMRVHIFPFPGISQAVVYPIDIGALYESSFYLLDVFLSIKKYPAALDLGTIEEKRSLPVDINVAGTLGEGKISFRNILNHNMGIELILDGTPAGEDKIDLLYSIGFNGQFHRGNRINIIIDPGYKEISLPVIYTLNGRKKDQYK
ncbi:MAG: GNAT family N-acetyltransferase, partial [Candidatus Omnitrophica bacterium]|nr:GNAT family N-acetyltransferase [Candidatus Omnitrophota bacterium]